ncbi:aminoglycoside phosphotransferase family protein [Phytomonospora sp. NPDC050363]|uniref:aminoglycoside phosphotransferase family protein n=1 Tax=Phytomonospora sp. NPDC050363 TaxID=3155642 RepID=UPI0033F47B0C
MDDVARRLRACELRWNLEGAHGLDGGCSADVFAAARVGGDEVVVKLVNPPEQAHAEAAALAAWVDTGSAVRLIDTDFAVGALLLERVRPGTPLPVGNDEEASEVAAGLLASLHRAAPGAFPFATLAEVYPTLEARALDDIRLERRARGEPERGNAGLIRLGAAKATAMALCATTDRPVLLHGDFVDKNILRARDGYLAVDPSPRIGDPHSDVGFFAAYHPPAAAILQRASTIAELMGLDGGRATVGGGLNGAPKLSGVARGSTVAGHRPGEWPLQRAPDRALKRTG